MRRRSVYAFIAADYFDLVLQRLPQPTRNTETGGYLKSPGGPLVLAPQRMRIVQNVRRFTDGLVNAEAGDIPNTDYRLIARHDADIQVNDTFVWQGDNYYVSGIHEARTESVFAAIDLLGKKNRNG